MVSIERLTPRSRRVVLNRGSRIAAGVIYARCEDRAEMSGLLPSLVDSLNRMFRVPAEGGHLVLKIDVEGAEWLVLHQLPAPILGQFRQIIIEYHGFLRASDRGWSAVPTRVLEKIS